MRRDSPLEWLPGLATPSPSSVMYPGGGVSVIGKLALSGHVSPRPAAWARIFKLLRSPGIDYKEKSIQPALICKRLWSPGIDSENSIPTARLYVAWRAGTPCRVFVPTPKAGNRFLGSLKGLLYKYELWRAVTITLFLLGSYSHHRLLKNSSSEFTRHSQWQCRAGQPQVSTQDILSDNLGLVQPQTWVHKAFSMTI